jgi:alpha-L-arabinofuranosidase
VTRMISKNYQPLLVGSEVHADGGELDVTAKRSRDGKTLVLQVASIHDQVVNSTIQFNGFSPRAPSAKVEVLAGASGDRNSADNPSKITPRSFRWRHEIKSGSMRFEFPPRSFTVIRFD